VQNSSYVILSYKIKHNYDVKDFLNSYRYFLQKTIDIIWDSIEWIEKEQRNYYIVKRGRRKIKRCYYVYRNNKVRITIKPRENYLEFDLSRAWFKRKIEDCDLGELILKESELIITFRKEVKETEPLERIDWDLNKCTLDGFSPKYGWIRINLKQLYHIHRVHEIKRKRAQSKASKKHSLKSLVSRHGGRERNRARNFIHKLTTQLAKVLPNTKHGFEDLEKQGMYNKLKKHNREVAKQNWKQIVQYMSYKSRVKLVNPKNTSSICPMCGDRMLKLRKGQVVKCPKCCLTLDRQLCGAINIYLRMCGFSPSPSIFYRAVIKKMIPLWKMQMKRGSGVATKGGKGDDMSPMNSRGGLSLMNPKAYIGLPIPT